jgi:CheY-like chemotaxis protein
MNDANASASRLDSQPSQPQGTKPLFQINPIGDVLIVDDEIAITDLLAETLAEEGYTTRVAHDGASALLDILARQPALIILDIAMPVMTGDELLRRLRRNYALDIPIIVLTAGLHPERLLDQGANAALAKPFELDTLLNQVAHYAPIPARTIHADAAVSRRI